MFKARDKLNMTLQEKITNMIDVCTKINTQSNSSSVLTSNLDKFRRIVGRLDHDNLSNVFNKALADTNYMLRKCNGFEYTLVRDKIKIEVGNKKKLSFPLNIYISKAQEMTETQLSSGFDDAENKQILYELMNSILEVYTLTDPNFAADYNICINKYNILSSDFDDDAAKSQGMFGGIMDMFGGEMPPEIMDSISLALADIKTSMSSNEPLNMNEIINKTLKNVLPDQDMSVYADRIQQVTSKLESVGTINAQDAMSLAKDLSKFEEID